MPLSITRVFRRTTPASIVSAELRDTRIELLAAERRLETEQATVDLYRKRIARLELVDQHKPALT